MFQKIPYFRHVNLLVLPFCSTAELVLAIAVDNLRLLLLIPDGQANTSVHNLAHRAISLR